MNIIATDQAFYDLRWAASDDVSDRERSRVAATIAMIPEDCQSIMDIGAGNGFLSNQLVARGKSLVAVDISEVALARVKAPTLQRSADDLSGVRDRSHDLVLCTEMLEHLDDATYEGALREFNRVARSAILITVPNRENMRENTGVCAECHTRYHIWGHRRRFTPAELRTLFPDFNPVFISSFGDNLRRYNPLLLWIRTAIANGWAVDDVSPCPECHCFRTADPDHPGLTRLCNLLDANLLHPPYKPWLLALYRRK
jgi:ubiquinone/menaquinone biosynthesis C-methylase UbiE